MIQKLRRICQICSLIVANSYVVGLISRFIYTGPLKSFCVPFLNCASCPVAVFACPIGVMQHFVGLHIIPFFLIGFIGLIALSVGRMTCGWICPFGFLQEMMFKISKKEIKIPDFLGFIKYAVLIFLVLLIPYFTGEPWFSKLCPVGTLTAAVPWLFLNPVNPFDGETVIVSSYISPLFFIKILILFLLLYLFTMSKRPFCKVFCPMGAIFSVFNKVSIFKLKYNSSNCEMCELCEQECTAALSVTDDANSSHCVRCLKCTRCKNIKVSWLGS